MALHNWSNSIQKLIPFRRASTLLVFVAAAGCNFYHQKEEGSGLDTQALRGRVDYAMVRDQVLTPFRCLKCHGSQGGVTLETYEQVFGNLKEIENVVLGQKPTMPKDGPLPLPAKAASILRAWIDDGAPRTVDFVEPTPSPAASAQPSPAPSASPIPEPPTPVFGQVDYATVSHYIIQPYCLKCHSAGQNDPTLESYQDLKDNLADITQDVLVDKSMPRKTTLSATQLQLVQFWVDAGAPESLPGASPSPSPSPAPSTSPSPAPSLTPILATYTSIRAAVFEKRCLGCHKVGGTAADVPLADYAAMLASPRGIVDTAKPEESGLLIAIQRAATDKKIMPPKGPLPPDQIAIIEAWILAGAPEN